MLTIHMRMQAEKMVIVSTVYIASAIFIASSYPQVLKIQAVLFLGPSRSRNALVDLHVHSCSGPNRLAQGRTGHIL